MTRRDTEHRGPWDAHGCPIARCNIGNHSPGGAAQGTVPFRPGKTERDHASGRWARRLANRRKRSLA